MGDAIRRGDGHALDLAEAVGPVERLAGQRGHQREHGEALRTRRALTGREDLPAEAAPSPVAAHEHRAHAGRLGRRVEEAVIVVSVARAREEAVAPAPAAAGHDLALGFVHVVGAVVDQVHVQLSDVDHGAGGLRLVVEAGKQLADRSLHQLGDRRSVRGDRSPQWRAHLRRTSRATTRRRSCGRRARRRRS